MSNKVEDVNYKIKEWIEIIFKSIFTGLALSMDYIIKGVFFIDNIIKMGIVFTFVVLIYYLYNKYKVNKNKIKYSRILSVIFAVAYIVGDFYFKDAKINNEVFLMIKRLITFIGLYNLYYALIHFLYKIFNIKEKNNKLSNRIIEILRTKTFLYTFIFLVICWGIHIVLKYPAGICIDASYQIDQGLGNRDLTTHHPLFHTMLMTYFVKFGFLIGSANVGIFLFVILEAIVLIAVISYGISFLIEVKANNWAIILTLLFFGFSPYVIGYIGTVIKDLYFAIFSLLFTIVLAEYVFKYDDFWNSLKKPMILMIATSGMVLFRNNGVYVIVPIIIILIIMEIKHRSNRYIYKILTLIFIIALPILTSSLLEYIYTPKSGSIREKLSLPFQQTARFVKYHSDKVLEEEKEIIDKILPYDSLGELYNPYISDPVKGKYNNKATFEELKDYFVVWIKQFFREPICYIEATVQQNIILLYPGYDKTNYYIKINDGYVYNNLEKTDYFETPEIIEEIQDDYKKVLKVIHKIPVLKYFNNVSSYVIVTLICSIFIITDKKYKHLIYVFPSIICIIIIILAPCIRGHIRYAFPIIYTLPIIISLYTSQQYKEKEKI